MACTKFASASDTHAPVELQGSGWPLHVREVKVSKKWSSEWSSCQIFALIVNGMKNSHQLDQAVRPAVPSVASRRAFKGAISSRWFNHAGTDWYALRMLSALGHE